MNQLLVIVGPSGSGKSTLAEFLKDFGYQQIISCTTRKPRPDEINGVHYYFKTKEEFDKIKKIEYTLYAGNYYGTTYDELQEQLNKENCFCIMDINGALKMKKWFPQTKIIFIYSNIDVLNQRMLKRGDSIEKINERISNILEEKELDNYIYADLVINNKDLNETYKIIKDYINKL